MSSLGMSYPSPANWSKVSPSLPVLPNELWLQILENAATDNNYEHLWLDTRLVCKLFCDYVERFFTSKLLQNFAISLSLPRRDPVSNKLNWPVSIPTAAVIFELESLDTNSRSALFKSPCILKDASVNVSVEELRRSNALPRERLIQAFAWVFSHKNHMNGIRTDVPKHIDWSDERGAWIWRVEWRTLVTQFYEAKRQRKRKSEQRKPSRDRRR